MPSTMEHERFRFNTMTFDQLRTRLGKITHQDKLSNFTRLCDEKILEYHHDKGRTLQYQTLRELALKRKNDISKFGGDKNIFNDPVDFQKIKKSNNESYLKPMPPVGNPAPQGNYTKPDYDHSFRKSTCFGGNLYNKQKACMTCSLEGECEKKWLANEEKKVPKKHELKKPKAVIDVLPSRRIRLD